MIDRPIYTGDDPLLRWYASNGTGWTETRFEDNVLAFLRWQEAVNGTPYEVVVDRVPETRNLRLVVDVRNLFGPPADLGPPTRARCTLTRRITVGDTFPGHEVYAFTQGGTFFVASTCGRRRLGMGTSFFTDPQTSGERARGLARQVIETARAIADGKQGGRKAVAGFGLGDEFAASSIFTDCGRWPWRT